MSGESAYAPRIHARARGFRLLAHAEFESFLEDRVVKIADQTFVDWRDNGVLHRPVVGVLGFADTKRPLPDSLINPPVKPSPDLVKRVQAAKNSLTRYARTQNHGVRESNVLRLLLPLGVAPNELDMAWLLSLDSWAQRRGDFASAPASQTAGAA